jgi:hypothetical protein
MKNGQAAHFQSAQSAGQPSQNRANYSRKGLFDAIGQFAFLIAGLSARRTEKRFCTGQYPVLSSRWDIVNPTLICQQINPPDPL